MKIVALIPARGGSKSIPRKNIISYLGKPLIAHSIEIALKSSYITDVIVSTDDREIADIAKSYGAKVPFMRPKEISEDLSNDLEVFTHYLQHDNPDIIVHLRPTYPNRNLYFLNKCIERFLDSNCDSLRTVVFQEKSPYKMYRIIDNNLIPLFENIEKMKEPYNQCRQILPTCYLHNGCIDIVRSSVVMKGSMCGKNILPIIMNKNDDIDTREDLKKSLYNSKYYDKKYLSFGKELI